MARIANVNIPSNKRLLISLTYIYGIGLNTAKKLCQIAQVDFSKRVKELTDQELINIRTTIEKNYTVEGDLRREVQLNIKRKMDIKCYQGIRHMRKLPVHGQRTHSNARTRKGKAIAIAGKKKVTK